MEPKKESYAEIRENSFPVAQKPKVSVAMIAYNIEGFLPAAIESVLSQKTNFKVELVIGEDCSPDNTRQIALDYQSKYPEIIKVLLPEQNQGLTPNSVMTQNACSGEYIALLDGDDYWTNPDKLQMQVDFLDVNKDYSASAHQAVVIYDGGNLPEHHFGFESDADYLVEDTISHRKFHTSSVVYRKELWDRVGGIPKTILSNERAIYPMLAVFGKIKYFGKAMCIYRKSSLGISSRITSQELETDLNMLPWLRKISGKFPVNKFKSFLHFCIYTYPARIKITQLIKHYLLFLLFSFSYFPANLGDVKFGTSEFIRILRYNSFNKNSH